MTCKYLEGQSDRVVILIKFLSTAFLPSHLHVGLVLKEWLWGVTETDSLEKENYFLWSLLHASPNYKHTWFPIIDSMTFNFIAKQQPTPSLYISHFLHIDPFPEACWPLPQ